MKQTMAIIIVFLSMGRFAYCQAISATSAGPIVFSAWNSFSSGLPVNSLQASGQVSTYVARSAEKGAFTATANADGSGSMQLSTTSGMSGEMRKLAADGAFECSWTGSDATPHPEAFHNCWRPISWIFPSIALQPGIIPQNIGFSYVGHETLAGKGVEHIQVQVIYGTALTSAELTSLIQTVSTSDLYIDSSSYLPVLLHYTLRADEDANLAFPVDVTYSNFATSGGLVIPQHIERRINGSLHDVIDISNVGVN